MIQKKTAVDRARTLHFIFLVMAVFSAITFFSEVRCHAELFYWIDDHGVLQVFNRQPKWWKQEKLVYHHARIVDKPATLKAMGLPLKTPDFDEGLEGEIPNIDVKKEKETITFSSTGKNNGSDALKTTQPKGPFNAAAGYTPRSRLDFKSLQRGSVIGDVRTRLYHTPDCSRVKIGSGNRARYRIPLIQMRIFRTTNEAVKNGYSPDPVCGGKPY